MNLVQFFISTLIGIRTCFKINSTSLRILVNFWRKLTPSSRIFEKTEPKKSWTWFKPNQVHPLQRSGQAGSGLTSGPARRRSRASQTYFFTEKLLFGTARRRRRRQTWKNYKKNSCLPSGSLSCQTVKARQKNCENFLFTVWLDFAGVWRRARRQPRTKVKVHKS